MTSFKFVALLIISVLFSSCVNTSKIQSIECVYHQNGQESLSQSMQIEMRAKHKNGVTYTSGNMADIQNGAIYNQGKFGGSSYYALKNYEFEVTGGEQRLIPDPGLQTMGKQQMIVSDIVNVTQNYPPKINQVVKVVARLQKRHSIADTLIYRIDYKNNVYRNFDAGQGSNGSEVVVYASKVHDQEYFDHFGCSVYQVKIESGDYNELLLMSENDSRLEISNRGGEGFKGGRGADGENRTIEIRLPSLSGHTPDSLVHIGRKSGNAENGLKGGTGYTGGKVTLYLDPSAEGFEKLLIIDNRGGNGGEGGDGGIGGDGNPYFLDEEGKRSDGLSGARGPQGDSGEDGPSMEIVQRELGSFFR